MKPVRQLLYVPAYPGGQGTILVILVHGGEVAPLRIAAEQLDAARFEINAEPLPLQQEKGGARGRMAAAQAGPQAGRGEKQGEEAGLQQHAVGLIAGKIL